jgi:hypothetical protein
LKIRANSETPRSLQRARSCTYWETNPELAGSEGRKT